MRLSRDLFSIHGVHRITQGLEMAGKLLLEDQQKVTYEFAVIFDALQQFSEIHDRLGHALFLLSGENQSLGVGRFCQSVNLRTKETGPHRFGDVATHSSGQVFLRHPSSHSQSWQSWQ